MREQVLSVFQAEGASSRAWRQEQPGMEKGRGKGSRGDAVRGETEARCVSCAGGYKDFSFFSR